MLEREKRARARSAEPCYDYRRFGPGEATSSAARKYFGARSVELFQGKGGRGGRGGGGPVVKGPMQPVYAGLASEIAVLMVVYLVLARLCGKRV